MSSRSSSASEPPKRPADRDLYAMLCDIQYQVNRQSEKIGELYAHIERLEQKMASP